MRKTFLGLLAALTLAVPAAAAPSAHAEAVSASDDGNSVAIVVSDDDRRHRALLLGLDPLPPARRTNRVEPGGRACERRAPVGSGELGGVGEFEPRAVERSLV